MPNRIFDPTRIVLEERVSVDAAATIAKIGTLCGAKSLSFPVIPVLRSARSAFDRTVQQHPTVEAVIKELQDGIESALEELAAMNMVDVSLAPGFSNELAPALTVLIRLPTSASPDLFEAAGNMLVAAWLTDLPPANNRFKRLKLLVAATNKEPSLTETQAADLETLLQRSRVDLLEVLAMRSNTADRATLQFNARLLIHLRSSLNSEHVVEQRCADQRKFLAHSALVKVTSDIKSAVEQGDITALLTLVGFCVGLPWDLTLQLSILRSENPSGHLMWLDVRTGHVHVRIKPLLRELGQPMPGCAPTKDVFRLPLPRFVLEHVKTAVALTPRALRLGDLDQSARDHPSDLDEHWIHSDRARFIRSATVEAIRLEPNRMVAAYSFLSFHLITKPDLHYITITETQLWSLRSKLFDSVGLGPADFPNQADVCNVGSMRSAQASTVRSIFEQLDQRVLEVRVGRRYSQKALIEYHNRYTRRVAMALHFSAGGRASHEVSFSASSWFSGSIFGFIDDKDAGAAGGRTPIPIPPSISEQLRLWELHLCSLQQRLQKLLGHRSQSARDRILHVLDREPISTFFLLESDGSTKPLLKSDLFVGSAATLNRDFGRHHVATQLTANGETLAGIHCFLRHQGDGINPASALGVETARDRVLNTALAVDQILLELNIRPLPGMGGGA